MIVPTAPACVVDVRLSLGPGGLYWVLGLARTLPVWLAESHWSVVEDSFYLGQEAFVRDVAGLPEAPSETCRAVVAGACDAWRDAERSWRLETWPNLFWSADRLAEAVVPKDRDTGLVERRDALAAGLDRRHGRSPETVDALADCARDVLALAAALAATLTGGPPIVLTTLVADEQEPALARSLAAADIPCRRVSDAWIGRLDALLAPALIRAGLATAVAAGRLRLAGLQVVAPIALGVMPADDVRNETDALAWNAAAQGDEACLWDGAAATCWEVSCAA